MCTMPSGCSAFPFRMFYSRLEISWILAPRRQRIILEIHLQPLNFLTVPPTNGSPLTHSDSFWLHPSPLCLRARSDAQTSLLLLLLLSSGQSSSSMVLNRGMATVASSGFALIPMHYSNGIYWVACCNKFNMRSLHQLNIPEPAFSFVTNVCYGHPNKTCCVSFLDIFCNVPNAWIENLWCDIILSSHAQRDMKASFCSGFFATNFY